VSGLRSEDPVGVADAPTTGVADDIGTEPAWQLERRFVTVEGMRRPLRLVRFATAWVASVDLAAGPTLGVDRSPYLATARALEPLGVDMSTAMSVVGRLHGR
jgi:hypothetical protein